MRRNMTTHNEMPKDTVEEFQKVRTDAISEMFDNVDENGIYPTTKFFNTLDDWLRTTLQSQVDEYEREKKEAYAQGWNEGQQALKQKYEREKGEMVREILKILKVLAFEGVLSMSVSKSIDEIIQKYGVDLSE